MSANQRLLKKYRNEYGDRLLKIPRQLIHGFDFEISSLNLFNVKTCGTGFSKLQHYKWLAKEEKSKEKKTKEIAKFRLNICECEGYTHKLISSHHTSFLFIVVSQCVLQNAFNIPTMYLRIEARTHCQCLTMSHIMWATFDMFAFSLLLLLPLLDRLSAFYWTEKWQKFSVLG